MIWGTSQTSRKPLYKKIGLAVGRIGKNVVFRSHFSKGRKGYLYMWFLRNVLLKKVTKVIIKYSLLESSSFPFPLALLKHHLSHRIFSFAHRYLVQKHAYFLGYSLSEIWSYPFFLVVSRFCSSIRLYFRSILRLIAVGILSQLMFALINDFFI